MGNLRESLPVVRQQSNGRCVRTSINRSLYTNDWRTLGRRLTFKEAQLKEFEKKKDPIKHTPRCQPGNKGMAQNCYLQRSEASAAV